MVPVSNDALRLDPVELDGRVIGLNDLGYFSNVLHSAPPMLPCLPIPRQAIHRPVNVFLVWINSSSSIVFVLGVDRLNDRAR
jgi:hypothetical protein